MKKAHYQFLGVHLEGRAGNMFVGELDGDVVVAGLGREVLDVARSIAVVLARDHGLARALDSQTESTGSGLCS